MWLRLTPLTVLSRRELLQVCLLLAVCLFPGLHWRRNHSLRYWTFYYYYTTVTLIWSLFASGLSRNLPLKKTYLVVGRVLWCQQYGSGSVYCSHWARGTSKLFLTKQCKKCPFFFPFMKSFISLEILNDYFRIFN